MSNADLIQTELDKLAAIVAAIRKLQMQQKCRSTQPMGGKAGSRKAG